jgi:hypothetical protein
MAASAGTKQALKAILGKRAAMWVLCSGEGEGMLALEGSEE